MKKTVQVEVASVTYNLGQALRDFLQASRRALSDGWQPGSDLPVVLMAAYADIIPHIKEFEQIPAEAKEDVGPFLKGLSLSLEDIVGDFLKPVKP